MKIGWCRFLIPAAVCAIGSVRADSMYSTYEWSTTSSVKKPADSGSSVDGVMAYLIDWDLLKQDQVLADVVGGNLSLASYVTQEGIKNAVLSSKAVENGYVTQGKFTRLAEGTPGSAYFILQMDFQSGSETLAGLYFSGRSTIAPVEGTGTGTLVLNPISSRNPVNYTTTFQGSMEAGAGGGWYAVVPEPTSGLLLVFGLAGLALRRKKLI